MASENRRGGVSRVERKLQDSLDNGNFYEAHQMYRTLYSRYTAQNKHMEVQELMTTGALLFFIKNESGSAVDLCLLYLDSLENSKTLVTDEIVDTIGKLHSSIDKNHPQLNNFEVKAITWTTLTEGVPKTGLSKLRYLFAVNLWKEKNYGEARQHFLYANNGVMSGEMLVEFSLQCGGKDEDDLFITQFVLQLLCIRSKESASEAFTTYTDKHPRCEKTPPFAFPLLNFIWFLLATVESQKMGWFVVLCDLYKPSLMRDPENMEYLEKIGENFFGIKLPKKQKGLIGNLLQNLMGEGGSEGESGVDVEENSLSNGIRDIIERSDIKMMEEELD